MMNIIYKPTGPALEYASLALNIYKGCEHGCRYCFGPSALKMKRDNYYADANPKQEIIDRVRKDAEYLAGINNEKEILLSFIGDPYQPYEMKHRLIRKLIEVLIEYNQPFTILTKGGMRAYRDFKLLKTYPKARFGTSISFINQEDADYWEPQAEPLYYRAMAIQEARYQGIKTWVSLEPVIIPKQAIEIIKILHPFVDHWKVGKINHMKKIEDQHDWKAFREEARDILDSVGADYYLKKSLTKL